MYMIYVLAIVYSIVSNLLSFLSHSCVKYVPEPEDSVLLHTAIKIFRKFRCYPLALRLALMLNDQALIKELFLECPNGYGQKFIF